MDFPVIALAVEANDGVAQVSYWMNTRFKLSQPKVQVWTALKAPEESLELPSETALPMALSLQLAPLYNLPIDGHICMKTSFELAVQYAESLPVGAKLFLYPCTINATTSTAIDKRGGVCAACRRHSTAH